MNKKDNGESFLKGHKWDEGKYDVIRITDFESKPINPLTGSSDNYFTCRELEVFALD